MDKVEKLADGEKPNVLIVDDQLLEAEEIVSVLKNIGCECAIVGNISAFIEEVANNSYQLVMIDFSEIDDTNIDTLEDFIITNKETPVIVMAEKMDLNITANAIKLGIVDYIIKPVREKLLLKSVQNALKTAISDPNDDVAVEDIDDTASTESIFLESSLTSASNFIGALESKTAFFDEWSQSVADICVMIAKGMNLPENEIWTLRSAAILHDIGNYNMEGSLLEKAKLTDTEQEQLKKHAENSAELATNIEAPPEVSRIIRHHHERYNGEGYPDGLEEELIPLGSRILAVADAYVAMRSPRAFREPLPEDKAIFELRSHSGKQFDPAVIKGLIDHLEQKRDA